MKNSQRIWAVAGLVLIVVSVLCIVITGVFPALRELLMTISTVTFLAAASILGFIVMRRKAAEEQSENGEEGE